MTNSNTEVCERILYTKEEIAKRCKELGEEISLDYADKEITFISILNGAFMFTADLLKNITADCRIDFMQVSTYGDGSTTSGNFLVKKGLSLDIEGKDVVIVEDILDTGFTMTHLLKHLGAMNPNSIKVCTLIDKPQRREHDVSASYVGFTMEKEYFIVGYGLDYAQQFRNLPYIGILKSDIYS